MTTQDKLRWKKWADKLRQQMMQSLTPEVSKSVAEITDETATTRATSTLHSTRYWKACQTGKSPNDVLSTAGFELDYHTDENQKVESVTLRLNETWMSIMQRVLDRKR